jgi:hypothetical protein
MSKALKPTAFREVGASGCRYSRTYVLDTLEQRYAQPVAKAWKTRDFHCLEIAPNHYLLTYSLVQEERVTSRVTLWKHSPASWQILFHQGTVVADL